MLPEAVTYHSRMQQYLSIADGEKISISILFYSIKFYSILFYSIIFYLILFYTIFYSFFKIFFWWIFFYVLYSTLLHLPPLRFHCADGCWDRTQDRCNWCIGSQTL
jgi:hypothetical protein